MPMPAAAPIFHRSEPKPLTNDRKISLEVRGAGGVSLPLEAALVDLQAQDLRVERRRRHSQLHRGAGGPRDFAALRAPSAARPRGASRGIELTQATRKWTEWALSGGGNGSGHTGRSPTLDGKASLSAGGEHSQGGKLPLHRSGAGHLAHGSDKNLARLRAVRRADHPFALQPLDHPRRAVVADPHLALEHGDGHLAHLADHRERLIVQLVGEIVVPRTFDLAVSRAEDRFVVDRLALRFQV